ncbi:uncharacterized protein N7458_009935 [Penicillium daleae]|uniref:U4/U6.U5 small nuclear ribonucleoprotein 27kDa protein domain-containing protein n=1 Tax=Penicillium daleae TaxID=63821 RepID=A0AAD6BZL7_9EURO|nr:uncharacterized protein N7458_009935 [Penicillium daleae]KAJ5438937.1 hypothetical protein N7458_009935 [Penicillium daleae]
MTEPPAKRARRIDSSTMWEKNDSHSVPAEQDSEHGRRPSPPPETTDATARVKTALIARIHEIVMTEGEKGAGLEIAVTETGGIETEMDGDKFRDRSRSPPRNGTKTRSPPPRGPKGDRRPDRKDPRYRDDGRTANGLASASRYAEEMDVDFKEDADEDEMEAMMRKSMGFTRFRTTKNTKVPGNNIYGVRKEKKSEYRQYMNRTGGFNRPLSPSR